MEEEKDILEEGNKSLIPIIVGVITLLVLVIGATYAYFAVSSSNNFGTTSITADADSIGTVTLTNINSALSMSLTAADMMRDGTERVCRKCMDNIVVPGECTQYISCNEGTQDCECSGGYNSIPYYATPSGKTTTETMSTEIARATVTPNTDTNYYVCDYTLDISNSGTTNMYTTFNNMANKSAGQIVFQINDTAYDWYTDGMPSTYSGTMIVDANNPVSITAGLKIVNSGSVDQSALAGSDIIITISATSFNCRAENPTYAYYDANHAITPASSSSGMTYYWKKTIVNSTDFKDEVCGVFGSTTVCMPYNAYSNASSYYTQLTGAGATCTYSDTNSDSENDTLTCTLDNVSCVMNATEASCSNSSGSCTIAESTGACQANLNDGKK